MSRLAVLMLTAAAIITHAAGIRMPRRAKKAEA
jgi:hypothetical protein